MTPDPAGKMQARKLLRPLVPLYAGVVAARAWCFDRGVWPARRLAHPVVSVGSLSAGGAGKTPVVVLLAELLASHGFAVCVLSRGYGRSGTAVERVDAAGDATRYGDEPLLLARRLARASVFVGADRHQAGRLAELHAAASSGIEAGSASDLAIESKSVYLLDDGFQHRKLARDVDVVVLTQREFEDALLPAGNLREPLAALRRADIVMVREDEPEMAEQVAALGNRHNGAPQSIWTIRRRLRFPENVMLPARPLVFCGIARPEGFLRMLAATGIAAAGTKTFRDHHAFQVADIEALTAEARQLGADGFLTTEKDLVKLTGAMLARLQTAGPVVAAPLEVALVDAETRAAELVTMLEARLRKPLR